jgi:predicted ester cyclase
MEENEMGATTLDANKALVRAFNQAQNEQDYDALDGLVTADIVRHSAATPDVQVSSRNELKAWITATAATFSDFTTTLERLVAEGDMVAAYATLAGTMDGPMGDMPPTGNRVEMPFMAIFRIENDLIAELWVEWDNVNLLSQLGLFPPPGSPGETT